MVKVAPSILAADFSRLGEQLAQVSAAEWIHIDVMDGHFVPNISMGPLVVEAVRRSCGKLLDVHLMVEEPIRFVDAFAKAGADRLTVHVEACRHLHGTLAAIRERGLKAGVALNPATPIETVRHVLHMVDLVLVMTVNPGFGGQKYLPEAAEKLPVLRNLCRELELTGIEFEVDGGIDRTTVRRAVESGATVLVAGTAVFGAADPAAALDELQRLARSEGPPE